MEPQYYHEVTRDPLWRQAKEEEIHALKANQTWTIEDSPPPNKPISSKWVYKVKYKLDGSVERYNAHLVIRGDYQAAGFDYTETFAPDIKMTSVRVFLSVVVAKGWHLHQLDINNAFLHGDSDKEVFMKSPPRFLSSLLLNSLSG